MQGLRGSSIGSLPQPVKGGKQQVGGVGRRSRRHFQALAVIRDGTPAVVREQQDPDKPLRRYGRLFGKSYTLSSPMDWIEDAPRVRVRSTEDRKLDELLELAVLNERITGGLQPWQARARLEHIKMRRRNWEAIYHYITETDAVATLELIEEANSKVEEALNEGLQSRTGVGALQKKLLVLQQEVNEASEKLQATQSRVEMNLKRVNELKAEAATLERMRQASKELEEQAISNSLSDGLSSATVQTPLPISPAQMRTSSQPSTSYAPADMPRHTPEPQAPPRRGRGLHSSLEMEDALRSFWYPAEFTKKLTSNTLVPFEIFGESWVLFRDAQGKPSCIKDSCAHRACPLSLGKVVEGQVVCAYHGWQFNGEGTCTEMPSTAFCRNVAVAALPCVEKDGFVWVWPGDGVPPEVPSFTAPPPGFDIHAEIMVDVPVEHGLLVENLLDLAHAPFTHTTTFARGWPVPDVVRFQATKVLSGNWDPYPISMSFQPPCITVSTIGLAQPGKIERGVKQEECKKHLHQLHVCMPSKRGHTRLLYRMSMDFMGWAKAVPGIQQVWKQVAAQVLGEDLVLVRGQQERMQQGEDTWRNPMAYDKLAVRYRRWRNAVAEGETEMGCSLARGASMSAGELFCDEDEREGECDVPRK